MLLLGNEAIARGALEAGVSFATCYPGTPSSEIPMNFFSISQESDLYFEYSTNEKVAMEVAAAAAVSGLRTIVTMKHVGLNVAADPLMTLAYVGVKGGMVISPSTALVLTVHNLSFLWMKFQPAFLEPLPQHLQHIVSLSFTTTVHKTIVRISTPWFVRVVFLQPLIKRIM